MTRLAGSPSRQNADFVALEPSFADPVHNAQACFRAVLEAMAHPGRIVSIPALPAGTPPAPLFHGSAAIALTLCDSDTPVWLDKASPEAVSYLAFHCGAPLATAPGEARFAFASDADALPSLDAFALGSDEYPERSATLVLQVFGLANRGGVVLRGPGVRDEIRLDAAGLPPRFWTERAELNELFPRGLDVLFVSRNRLAALPRSTRIAA